VNVLVTGGTSLIGRAVVDRLVARGDTVTTFQRTASSGTEQGSRSAEVSGSITDPGAVARACDGIDAVVHLAAKVGVVGAWRDYEHANVGGTRLLIETALRSGVGRFVQVSSPSVAHAGRPIVGEGATPADPESARGHYARSKALAEQFALGASTPAMPVVAIRPHLVWGPGDTQLVGRIVARARSGRLLLVGSGLGLVDTTYVDNAGDALVAAVARADALGGRALVVSNGEPRTMRELTTRIVAAAGVQWTPRHVPVAAAIAGGAIAERVWRLARRADDPPMTRFLAEQLSTAHWFDQRDARAALEWQPAVSLDEGFRRLAASLR
jgi:nucleoside-diphosphate-sugar epimerase